MVFMSSYLQYVLLMQKYNIVFRVESTQHNLIFCRTWKNSQLMGDMIKQLEDQGLQMAKQKQEYFGETFLG